MILGNILKALHITLTTKKGSNYIYVGFYHINFPGIDVDGRIEEVENFMMFFQKKIASIVAFGKSIPGFRNLSLDDQANLVKGNRKVLVK